METAICVSDPSGQLRLGELVEDARRLALARSAGAVLLPADPDLVNQGAVRGYFRRDWGLHGRWNRMVGAPGCPMLLYAVPGREHLYWAAEIEPMDPELGIEGTFRLGADTTQHGTAVGGIGVTSPPANLNTLVLADGKAIIRGHMRLGLSSEGYLPLSLYGVAKNVCVRWTAITQSMQDLGAW